MRLFKKKPILNPYRYEESKCVICNIKSEIKRNNISYTCDICPSCHTLGFASKTSYPARSINKNILHLNNITGVSLNKKLLHTFYLGKEIPKKIQLYFLSNLKKLNAEGIFWVDAEKIEITNRSLKIMSENTFPPIKFTVKSVPDLLNEFKNTPSSSYLSTQKRNEIVQMIYAENSGYFKKAAYSTDALRLIALLLYGGLYVDTNTRITEKISALSEIPEFGAKYIAIKSYMNSSVYEEYFALSNLEHGRVASSFANQKLNLSTTPSIYTQSHDSYYFSVANMSVRPECSAILGNKGALFFDIVLFDMLERYQKRNKVYNYYLNEKHSKNLQSEDSVFYDYMSQNLGSAINTRNPIIINSMLLAQRFIMLKVDVFDEKYFYFANCHMSDAKLEKELTALGYKGAVFFDTHGHRFIKYYSHSHKSSELPTPHSSKFERDVY
ncbi:glycosyltransferase [Pigmentibacter ruber]|nr:hypothetical protein GTC16762_27820 [Pigmentibacter ruber]